VVVGGVVVGGVVGRVVGGVVGGLVTVPPPDALPPDQFTAPLATVLPAGTLSVRPSVKVTLIVVFVMFDAT
jgi:hypothetical protein